MCPRPSPESSIGGARYCGVSRVYHRLTVQFWAARLPGDGPSPFSTPGQPTAQPGFASFPLPSLFWSPFVASFRILRLRQRLPDACCSLGRAHFPTWPSGFPRRLLDPREQQGWVQGRGRLALGPMRLFHTVSGLECKELCEWRLSGLSRLAALTWAPEFKAETSGACRKLGVPGHPKFSGHISCHYLPRARLAPTSFGPPGQPLKLSRQQNHASRSCADLLLKIPGFRPVNRPRATL